MAIYEKTLDHNNSTLSHQIKERYIYGSNRVGTFIEEAEMIGSSTTNTTFSHHLGARNYELVNHLGNVLAVVSDAPIKVDTNNDHLRDYNLPTLLSSQDYYPFGSLMRERSFGGYRYGFNGQEKVDEISGEGNHNTALFWEYDTRLGRRWNIDPVVKHDQSGYSAFANNPLWFTDPTGADTVDITLNNDGLFIITGTQNVDGDDVFRLTIDDEISLFTFSDGEYGERVNTLNLESTAKYTLGVYHISGEAETEGGTGFYVTPGGAPSKKAGSNKRLPDGEYQLNESPSTTKWVMPWVVSKDDSKIASRGVKFHPAYSSSPHKWTKACYVVFSNYQLNKCLPSITTDESINAAYNFRQYIGGTYDI